MLGDQILPDRHRVATVLQPSLDELAVRLACAGRRAPVSHQPLLVHRLRAGDHLYGRFCRPVTPAPRWTDGDPLGLEIRARRFSTDARRGLDSPQTPSESAKCQYLLLFVVGQDVAHPGEGPSGPPPRQRPGALTSYGRF